MMRARNRKWISEWADTERGLRQQQTAVLHTTLLPTHGTTNVHHPPPPLQHPTSGQTTAIHHPFRQQPSPTHLIVATSRWVVCPQFCPILVACPNTWWLAPVYLVACPSVVLVACPSSWWLAPITLGGMPHPAAPLAPPGPRSAAGMPRTRRSPCGRRGRVRRLTLSDRQECRMHWARRCRCPRRPCQAYVYDFVQMHVVLNGVQCQK